MFFCLHAFVARHRSARPQLVRMHERHERHAVGNDTAHLAQIDAIKRRAALLERLSAAPAALATVLAVATASRSCHGSRGWSTTTR